MLDDNTKDFFWRDLHENIMKFPAEKKDITSPGFNNCLVAVFSKAQQMNIHKNAKKDITSQRRKKAFVIFIQHGRFDIRCKILSCKSNITNINNNCAK